MGLSVDHWKDLGHQITLIIRNLALGTLLLESFNLTDLVFIPKMTTQSTLADYRPISIYNTIYKIFAKVLSNRLTVVLPNLISPN